MVLGGFRSFHVLVTTVCRPFVELNLVRNTVPSESVVPVSLQSRTYSVRFGT